MKYFGVFFQPLKLHVVIMRIDAVSGDQLFMGSSFLNSFIGDDDDLIGIFDGLRRWAMTMVVRFRESFSKDCWI